MKTARHIPTFVYKLMIIVATIIWGFSFVVMKDAVSVLEPAWLIGVRFFCTAVLLTIVFLPHMRCALSRDYLAAGGILGLLNFLGFWTQTIGLAYTTPGKNAFLTATYCVIVPFVSWVIARKRPTAYNLVAAVMCVTGIGLVSLTSGALTVEFGDFMTLVCALFFAVHIAFVSKLAQGRDILALTVLQFWVGGICGIAVGALTETAPNLAAISPDFIFNMFYLVVFASCVALVFQNVALAHVPPAQGSLFLSLESVFGVLFSVLLYGEELTARLLLGFALIFGAILVSEMLPLRPKAEKRPRLEPDPEEQLAPTSQAGTDPKP